MPTIRSYNKRLEALRSERSSFIPLYRELSDYHLAYRGRFLTSDRNKGHKRNTKQINNTSRLATRTLASGMMSGITSPARPWFRLGAGDLALDDMAAVKEWNHEVQMLMYQVFAASNTYNALHTIYAELGVFGVGCMGVFHDFNNVIWCRPYTVGSYMLALDDKNVTNTFYREYEISVSQCVQQFGIDNVSPSVKQQFERGNTENWVKVVSAIEPNDGRDHTSPMARDKQYRSVYYEADAHSRDSQDHFLRRSGFEGFPILAPRWDVNAEDVYATDCPGITALGDTKALQLAEKRKYQAIDKLVSPPLQGPSGLAAKMKNGQPAPNEVIWHDTVGQGLTSIYGNYRPEISQIKDEITNVEGRVSRAFYEDLFLMLANSDRRQITAREVAEKHEEKLLMLGPVLERLHTELLDPLIDRTFNIMQANGMLPPPPPELQGREVKVEYVSVLAQAQRLVNTGALDRLAAYTGEVAGIWPEARHKFDAVKAVGEYADALGVDPANVRSDDEVAAAVQAEAEAAAQQQAQEQAMQMAAMAKQAADTPMNNGSALDVMAERVGVDA